MPLAALPAPAFVNAIHSPPLATEPDSSTAPSAPDAIGTKVASIFKSCVKAVFVPMS